MKGERYLISFIDVRSRFKVIYVIKHKNDSVAALKMYIEEFLIPLKKQLKMEHNNININTSRMHTDMGKDRVSRRI